MPGTLAAAGPAVLKVPDTGGSIRSGAPGVMNPAVTHLRWCAIARPITLATGSGQLLAALASAAAMHAGPLHQAGLSGLYGMRCCQGTQAAARAGVIIRPTGLDRQSPSRSSCR